jgi:Rrf2 family protein
MEGLLLPRTAEYALRAAAVLAAHHDDDDPLPVHVISEASAVPAAYLAKVVRQLETAGLVVATRGRRGGFRLARPPEAIRFRDVLDALDLTLDGTHCAFGWARCNAAAPCPLHDSFAALRTAFLGWAEQHHLADVDARGALAPLLRTGTGT